MTHQDCDEALTRLYQYLDRELDEADSTLIRGHLDQCTGCNSRFDFEARLKSVVKERLSEEVPEEFLTRLRSALEREASTTG